MKDAIKLAIKGGYHYKDIGTIPFTLREKDGNWYLTCRDDRVISWYPIEVILMSPLFWQCLGKALGWKVACLYCGCTEVEGGKNPNTPDGEGEHWSVCAKCGIDWMYKAEFEEGNAVQEWFYHGHRFWDWVMAGKDVDEFFKNLLSKGRE